MTRRLSAAAHSLSTAALAAGVLLASAAVPTAAPAEASVSGTALPAPRAVTTIDAVAVPSGAEPLQIDGELAEDAWTRAQPVQEFLQRAPREGAAASHATDVRVLFDRDALYIAVRAMDPEPDAVVGHLTRRDADSPSDWVHVMIDSHRDRRTAFQFGVNAAGVKFDAYLFNDTNNDSSWDAVWDVGVARGPQGWRAEFRIPFSQLRFSSGATESMGFAVSRTIARLNETSTWPLLARSATGYVSSFGQLRGVTVAPAQKRLELSPYVLGQLASKPVDPADPLVTSPAASASAGLDLSYKLGGGLTFTGTLNPDFGQVEADPAVVNLGAFETFFAERRPFFVEGSGNFSFNVDCEDGQCTGLFYSRRIGRSPQRVVAAPDGGYVDQPVNTTILGAGKVTGRVGQFTIGALSAVTSRETATTAVGTPLVRSETPVEPAASYTVVRVSRQFANQSRFGGMFTNTSRALADELRFLPGSATTGGVDGDLRFGGRYSLLGYWAGSHVRGSEAAIDRLQRNNVHSFQRPDAAHLTYDPSRTSLGGHAGSISLRKIGGARTRFEAYAAYKTPGFDINDLGFQMRADDRNQGLWFQVRDDNPGRFVRSRAINVNQYSGWNFDGDRRYLGANVNANAQFTNNWNAAGGVNYNARGFNDRLTRGGPGGYQPRNFNGWGSVGTDNRRLVAGNFNTSWFRDGEGSWSAGVSPSLTLRPSSAVSVTAGVGYNRNVRDKQWIANVTGDDGVTHHVFGRLNQTTLSLETRVNYTIRPTLTLQVYARPFVSAGAYRAFTALADGRAASYDDQFAPFDYAGNPDFNVLSFRTTNVLRWEYRPGSALFVVWQQGREGFTQQGDFDFGRDFSGAFDAPATNVVLVKISRWINF
jgi:hypothetical protein